MASAEKNYMTPSGYKRIQDEYQQLKYDERPKLVETVAWAAGNGDRSENGDYIYGKKRLREIDRRLQFLSRRLDNAEIVDPTKINSEQILFGATVTVLVMSDKGEEEKTYAIVGADESEPEQGKISWKSPLARALFKRQVGDFVTFRTPQGEKDIEVLAIEYLGIK